MNSFRKGIVTAAVALGVYGVVTGPGAAQERRPDRPRGAEGAADQADRAGTQIRGRAEVRAQGGSFLQASTLIGMNVQVAGADQVGVVKDVIIDPRTCVQYVLLDTQGFVEVEGFVVVPWELFDFQTAVVARDSAALVLTVPAARLRTAPFISRTRVDLAFSAPWVNEVTTFYDAEIRERRSARPDLDSREPADRPGDRPRTGDRPGDRPPAGERPGQRPRTPPRTDDRPEPDPAPGTPPRSPRTPPRGDTPGTREPQPPEREPEQPRPREPQPENPTPEAGNP
jgi:hypothetical protein